MLLQALTRVDTDHSSVLSKEACFARTVADTMVKEKNQCERWNVRSTAGEEEDTAMELDSAEEDNDEGVLLQVLLRRNASFQLSLLVEYVEV